MDIKTFNKQLTYLGVVDNFDSVDFKTRFTAIGEFIITAPITAHNIKRLAKGNFILIGSCAGYIESLQLDEDFEESKLTAVGYDLKGLLSHRINWGLVNYSGTVENFFRKLVNDNCINTAEDRVLPFLELGEFHQLPETIEIQNEGSLISELITKQSELHKIGWDIVLNPKEKKLVFNTFKGVDRTRNQTSVTPLVFERERENVLQQVYVNSNEGYKNVVYVAGRKQEDTPPVNAVVGSSTGLERREMFIKATSQRKDENGEVITEADYTKLIETEGAQALAEKPIIHSLDCVVNTQSTTKFHVGDLCTVVESQWGLCLDTYISEIQRIYDINGFTLNVVFGDNIPIKKKGGN